MAMDLTVTEYATYDDLYEYVYGSAAVIGLQMVPDPRAGPRRRPTRARRTSASRSSSPTSCRDVGEDLDRGRRLPPARGPRPVRPDPRGPRAARRRRPVPRPVRFQIARVRRLEEASRPGIDLLHPTSRPCIEAARVLYCGIVDEVERIDYQVFTRAGHGLRRPAPRRRPAGLAAGRRRPPSRGPRPRSHSRGGPDRGARCTPRRPQHTHHASVSTTRANPNSRSSTGAYAMRPSPRKTGHGRRAEDRVAVVADDAQPGEDAVGDQLEEHDDRVGDPEDAAPQQPGAQHPQVEHDVASDAGDRELRVASRRRPPARAGARRRPPSP